MLIHSAACDLQFLGDPTLLAKIEKLALYSHTPTLFGEPSEARHLMQLEVSLKEQTILRVSVTCRDTKRSFDLITSGGTIPADFYHLIAALARSGSLAATLLPAHSAAAQSPDGRNILISGYTGCGKTTILAHLLQSGWSPLSGNTTVLDPMLGLRAVAATSTMSSRPNPETLCTSRVTYRLELPNRPVDITEIWLPVTAPPNSRGPDPRVEQLAGVEKMHALWPLLADLVRQDLLLNGGSSVFRTSYTHSQTQIAVSQLSASLVDIPVRRVVGTAEDIAAVVLS